MYVQTTGFQDLMSAVPSEANEPLKPAGELSLALRPFSLISASVFPSAMLVCLVGPCLCPVCVCFICDLLTF